jgi:glycosyltransferase involved in cell wall biosynthesis
MASFGPGYGRLESWVFRRVERVLGSRTAAFCVVGADLAGHFAAAGVPADRLHVVRSGVPLASDLRSRTAARELLARRHGTVPGRPLLCYVGSLEPRKNPLLLARILRRLHDRLAQPPDLLIVGDGPERDRLSAELCALGVHDHAVFTGHLSDPAHVHDALRAADVTLLLSRAEGLPQVLVQSAAVGTPFVSFDVEGVREVLSLGARGSAVPPGDHEGVVAAVIDWLGAAGGEGDEPTADLSSWSPSAITAGYRTVVDQVLRAGRPALPVPSPRGARSAPPARVRA